MSSAREHISSNLTIFLTQKKMTQKRLADLLGLSQTAVTNWVKGKNSPDIETLLDICKILDVSVNEMLGQPLATTAEDVSFLRRYNRLDQHGKSLVQMVTEKELERIETMSFQPVIQFVSPKEETENIFSIPFYEIPVSAGTGIYLQDAYREELSVESSPLTRKADFALRISGDSMEPRYHNGEILLVQNQETLEQGECGIFILNGEGYFKKLGDKKLISLNPDYRPIKIHDYDTLQCVGKVIGKLQ